MFGSAFAKVAECRPSRAACGTVAVPHYVLTCRALCRSVVVHRIGEWLRSVDCLAVLPRAQQAGDLTIVADRDLEWPGAAASEREALRDRAAEN